MEKRLIEVDGITYDATHARVLIPVRSHVIGEPWEGVCDNECDKCLAKKECEDGTLVK